MSILFVKIRSLEAEGSFQLLCLNCQIFELTGFSTERVSTLKKVPNSKPVIRKNLNTLTYYYYYYYYWHFAACSNLSSISFGIQILDSTEYWTFCVLYWDFINIWILKYLVWYSDAKQKPDHFVWLSDHLVQKSVPVFGVLSICETGFLDFPRLGVGLTRTSSFLETNTCSHMLVLDKTCK